MEEMAQTAQNLLERAPREISTSDTTMTLDMRVSVYNSLPGPPGAEPCPDCNGNGYIAINRNGAFTVRECQCMTRRRCFARIKRSGLGELYERYTLDTYTTLRPWQERMKAAALEYIEGATGWFFVCGRSGSGKTHITAAIARELIEAGMETRYFMWRQDAPRLKAMVNDRPEYERIMREFVDCRVLLLDDLWKGGSVTEADASLTFELLNARYNSPSKLTLISTEWGIDDILRNDEGIGGRIYERARGFLMQTNDENYRLKLERLKEAEHG